MFALRLAMGLGLGYVALVLLAWRFQDRMAFPAPRAAVPDPGALHVANAERVELTARDGTRLLGWFFRPVDPGNASTPPLHRPPTVPGLLWFYGNGENVAAIWPIVRAFQPPAVAVLVVDYPGYGGSGGRTTEAGLYAAADAAYEALAARREVDPHRIAVYGRSLGSAVATYTAAHHPTAALVLESPFTNAAAMARHLYALFPRFILRLRLDNVANLRRISCPVLVFHGDADRLVPTAMGLAVAAAASGPTEVVLIHGAGHNETYAIGGREYRDKLWEFIEKIGRETRDAGGAPTRPPSSLPRP